MTPALATHVTVKRGHNVLLSDQLPFNWEINGQKLCYFITDIDTVPSTVVKSIIYESVRLDSLKQ